MQPVEVYEQQRERLQRTIEWARRVGTELQPLLDVHGDRVHFRPSSSGVAMVGLLPDRPQRGERVKNTTKLTEGFEALFDKHCRNVEQGRDTAEKALQSFLIREAQTNDRRLASLNDASDATNDAVDLWFATDEIALPVEGRKEMVCDILALRRDGGRCTPVVLELKSSRQLTRLVEQVEGYAKLIDLHADLFAELFGALLGEDIRFDRPTEKWIVWPALGPGPDPHTDKLKERGTRLAAYAADGAGYRFVVGPGVASAASTSSFVEKTRVASTDDPRVTNLRRMGRGEGFATYVGHFENKAAFLVDCGTMNDIMDEDDRCNDSVMVRVFENEAARDRFVEQL